MSEPQSSHASGNAATLRTNAAWCALKNTLKKISLCAPLVVLAACGGGSGSGGYGAATTNAAPPPLSPAAALGKQMFNDISLSASGAQACATCHNPNNFHAQTNSMAVQLGGQDLKQKGFRAPPSLNYLNLTPAQAIDPNGNPSGGFDRDGRAPSLAAQAEGPLLSSFEMANSSKTDVVNKVKQAAYATQFGTVFGANVFDDPTQAFADITYALQQYQLEAPEFHPYTSKYDQYLNGTASLSASEMQGLALFNDPAKGNCNSCHPSTKAADGSAPAFTNFRFANLGLPRNGGIPNNASSSYFDLGVCGPDRTDLSSNAKLCGAFKIPTLRNVASRKVFFHNGSFNDLTTAVTFLVQRDTNPTTWYPQTSNGAVQKFNDLPSAYQANVDTADVPFNRQPGMAPALSSDEINALVQFLGTLTDGYNAAL
jgi:cytochrome c peroxidase